MEMPSFQGLCNPAEIWAPYCSVPRARPLRCPAALERGNPMTPAVLRNTQLARTVLAASLAAIGACAQAQTAPAVQNMESITVIGQAASIDRALEQQRSSDSIENVVH